MFTSKERSHLKSLAANLQPVMQVGKEGVGENLIKSLSDALEARELIKITILESATDVPRALADEIAALAELTVEDADALMQTALLEENRAYVQIDPQ